MTKHPFTWKIFNYYITLLLQAKYKHFQYSGDAVLLELEQPLVFGANVASACLSETPIDQSQSCMAAGWGVNKPGGTMNKARKHLSKSINFLYTYFFLFFVVTEQTKFEQQQYLSYLSVPTISIEKCNSSSHYSGSLSSDAICSDHSGSTGTTCYVSCPNLIQYNRIIESNRMQEILMLVLMLQLQNDEGAPLMCFDEKKSSWELHGILSYHGNCGRRPQPTIYSAMSEQLIHWITKTVGNDLMVSKRIA